MYVADSLLRRHVKESNLIEGIIAKPGEPEYEGHLVAARVASRGRIVPPNHLHRLLTRPVAGFGSASGSYRTCGVAVGSQNMPHWREVPALMEEWSDLVQQYQKTDTDSEFAAFLLHAWLLCIHPWIDGNGRTARLVWNMLRVSKGLSWHVQPAHTKYAYYVKIRDIEERIFKKDHEHAY